MHCPECDDDLPDGAVLCVKCGYHLKLRKRLKTRHGKRPLSASWDADLAGRSVTGPGRIGVGLGLMGSLGLGCVFFVLRFRLVDAAKPLPTGYLILALLVGTLLIWIFVGCFTRVQLVRDRHGKPALALSRRILYLSARRAIYSLDRYNTVRITYRVIEGRDHQTEIYRMYLGGAYKDDLPLVLIFSGSNGDRMRELCDALKEVANVTIDRL